MNVQPWAYFHIESDEKPPEEFGNLRSAADGSNQDAQNTTSHLNNLLPQTMFYLFHFHPNPAFTVASERSLIHSSGFIKKERKKGKKEALTTSDCVSQPGIYTTLWLLKVLLCFFFPSSKQRGFLRFLSELVVMGQLDDDKLVKTFQVQTGGSPVSDLQTRIPCKKKKKKRKEKVTGACLKLTQMQKDWFHHTSAAARVTWPRSGVTGLRWGFSWKCETEGRRWAGDFFFFFFFQILQPESETCTHRRT